MNNKQREFLASFLLDIAKAVLAVFLIGGLVPNSNISIVQVIMAAFFSFCLFIGSMRILRGYKNG